MSDNDDTRDLDAIFDDLKALHDAFNAPGAQSEFVASMEMVSKTMPKIAQMVGEGARPSTDDMRPILLAALGMGNLYKMLLAAVGVLRPEMECADVADHRGRPWGVAKLPVRDVAVVVVTKRGQEVVAIPKSFHDLGDGVVGVLDRCEDEPSFMHFFTASLRDDAAVDEFNDPHGLVGRS